MALSSAMLWAAASVEEIWVALVRTWRVSSKECFVEWARVYFSHFEIVLT